MSKRNRREHGRILSVETMQRGSALDVDAAAGATSITVTDAGDFEERDDDSAEPLDTPIGWLLIGSQVVAYTDCDDDAGVITLADPLTAAAEQGDPVHVYDPLYEKVVDYQVALVQLYGEHDNPDPVEAEVAETVEDLPEGDRGKAGESCTLHRISADEWEIIGVGGRPRGSRGVLFWQDSYQVTATGDQTFPLTHLPIDNSEHFYWRPAGGAGVYQGQSQWSRDGQTVTVPDPLSLIAVGDVMTVEYAYRAGITTEPVAPEPTVITPIGSVYSDGGSGTITSLALPSSTPSGALIVMGVCVGSNYGTGSFTCSDARMSKVADFDIDPGESNGVIGQLWVGYASTLGAVSFVSDPGSGSLDTQKIVIATFDGATADVARIATIHAGANLYTAPSIAGSGSGAILFAIGKHGVGTASFTSASGYSIMPGSQGAYKKAAMAYRLDATIPSAACAWTYPSGAVESQTIVMGLS